MKTLAPLALLAVAALAFAQDEAAKPAVSAKATERDLQPRPAEMAPRAAKSLLLGLAQAGDRIVAVGDRGVILASADGQTWDQVPCPVHATLTAVSFADAKTGWAVGHDATILHTADGGATWKLQNFKPADNKPLLSVLAVDAQRAYASGAYGLFLATTDGGATWTDVDAPEILADGLHNNALVKLGNGELFLAGETGLLGVSADGSDWKRLTLPYEGSLFGALPRGEKGAIVFGLRGNALATDDVRGGKWTRLETGTVQSLFGGVALADGTALLVGADGAMLRVAPDGKVSPVTSAQNAGTLSAILARGDGFIVAGENGVAAAKP